MKFYSYEDICEKISDKVKSVEDLYNLPVTEFEREGCDCWYDDFLEDPEYQGRQYFVSGNCMEDFYSAYYLINCRPECDYLVLLEYDGCLYFVFSSVGVANLANRFYGKLEELLRRLCELTDCLDGLKRYGFELYPF